MIRLTFMTWKQREVLQKVVGMLWVASFNKDVGEPITDALDLIDELLSDDEKERTNEAD